MRINTKQHIILVSLDTLRGDCVGPDKFRNLPENLRLEVGVNTKIIDSLIENGTFFKNCISAAPYTSAAHAAILTGFWPLNNQVYEYFNRKVSKPTLFEFARTKGYKTILQTDFPVMLGNYLGLNRGVDHFFIENEEKAIQLLLDNTDKKTLSLFHFGGIHYPYGFHTLKFGGTDYINKVEELENNYNIDKNEVLEDNLGETFRDNKDNELLFRYKRVIEYLYKNKKYTTLFKLYLEGIEYFLEHRFRLFLERIKPLLDKDNALLIIFADHGEEWSEESYGHFNSIAYGVLTVPLIFYGKNIPHKIINEPIRTIDIAPTIMKIIDPGTQLNTDGVFLDIFNQEFSPVELPAFSQTWIDPDKKELMRHQQNIIKNNKILKRLKTYKRGELVVYKQYRYSRKFDSTGTLIGEKFTDISGNEISANVITPAIKLKELLDDYNKNLPDDTKTNKVINKTEEIRKQFRLMGYEI